MWIRQTAFIGPDAQKKLEQSRVAIIGLGGTGTAVAQLLARMGIGELVLVDGDEVLEHNLGRQLLYTHEDIGKKKVLAAQSFLQKTNPKVWITPVEAMFSEQTKNEIPDVDLIIDCVDTHDARRDIDAYAKEKGLTWIHGAAIEDKGACCVFTTDLHYDDVYNKDAKDQHCEITGVVATSTALIGTLQAQLALLVLTGKEAPKGLFHVNLSTFSFDAINV